MAPRAEAVLLCDQVIQDAMSGKKSLIGVFRVIFTRVFPSVHPRMFIFASVVAAPKQKVIASWRFMGPKGHLQDMPMGELQLGLDGRGEVVGDLAGIPFGEPGQYRFILMLNDEEAGEAVVTVMKIGTETATPTTVH